MEGECGCDISLFGFLLAISGRLGLSPDMQGTKNTRSFYLTDATGITLTSPFESVNIKNTFRVSIPAGT